jgi:hypothetical protein
MHLWFPSEEVTVPELDIPLSGGRPERARILFEKRIGPAGCMEHDV